MRRGCVIAPLLFMVLLHAASAKAASITFESVSVLPGQSFEIQVFGSDLQDVYAFGFDLGFDAGVLSFTGAVEGDFLSKAGSTFFSFCPGQVACAPDFNPPSVFATLVGAVAGASSTNPLQPELLATLLFTGIAAGDSGFQLNARLLDSSLNDIQFLLAPGTITTVPEPSTLGLLGVGLVVMARHLRRKKPTAFTSH